MAALSSPPAQAPSFRKGRRKGRVTTANEESTRTIISYTERSHPAVHLTLGCITAFLVIGAITFLVPLIWAFSGAIKAAQEMLQSPPALLPQVAHWENYAQAWNNLNFPLYFYNTIIITIVGWFIPIAVSILAAYSFSKLRPVYGNIVMFVFLTTLMIPGVVYIIPSYLVVDNLGLLNTWWSLWLPGAFSAYNILITKSFFDSIPSELSDSAVLDGATPFQILWRIILPLSKPVIVVLSIGALMGGWQQFFAPFLYIQEPSLWPIGTALWQMTGNLTVNVRMAGLMIAALPPLIFYAIFQRQVIRGINLSGFMNG